MPVTNSGSRAGAEVVQLYLGYPTAANEPPGEKPYGDPFRVTTFENPSERVYSPVNTMELAIAPHAMILPIVEASGAVWVLENVNR